jgi:hypothetical protein
MAPFRSQETLQKEYDLQSPFTVKMNLALQSHPDLQGYRSKLEDSAVFANQLRKVVEGETLVVQTAEGRIWVYGEGEDFKVSLWLDGNCWGFEINDTTHYELEDSDKIGPSRAIKAIWDQVLPLLPENFIIRGVINPEYPGHEVRIALLQRLGFSDLQPNHEVYGIMKGGILTPLTLEQFLNLTQTTPQELQQKLSVKSIAWLGA